MGLFSKIINTVKKFENKKLMRAIVGGCLLVAAADGTIEQAEIEKMTKLLSANEALSGFKPSEITQTVQHFSDLLETDFDFGKKKILDEISQITDEQTQCEDVFICMMAVAKANGKIAAEERNVLLQVAALLKLKPSKYNL
jgi:tellurite resistance protein TerB